MSRGPGRVERAIESAFLAEPSRSFLIEELAAIVYPGINRIEKKHRVAILRAADRVSRRLGWQGWRCERPGGHIVYLNLFDVRSYAIGRLRADFSNNDLRLDQIERLIDDPTVHRSRAYLVQPGGAWCTHVEINKARRDGDVERADEMNDALNAGIAISLRSIGARS